MGKAYAGASADLIADYLAKGKGRNLSSIGDLLNTLAEISNVHTKPAEGEGYGLAKIPLIFSGTEVKVDNAISKINGLVNEYVSNLAQVKDRWPLGVHERSLCWSFLQALGLPGPGLQDAPLRGHS